MIHQVELILDLIYLLLNVFTYMSILAYTTIIICVLSSKYANTDGTPMPMTLLATQKGG